MKQYVYAKVVENIFGFETTEYYRYLKEEYESSYRIIRTWKYSFRKGKHEWEGFLSFNRHPKEVIITEEEFDRYMLMKELKR